MNATTTIKADWKEYSEAQIASVAAYRKRSASRTNQGECATLAAKIARRDLVRRFVYAVAGGLVVATDPPQAGQKGMVFEADRWGFIRPFEA